MLHFANFVVFFHVAQEEKNDKIRPSRNEDSSHVLRVYDKQWRFQRVNKMHDVTDVVMFNFKMY